jgi:CBS domain-containing membrane protein
MSFADKQDNARGGPSSFQHVGELLAKLRLEWLSEHFSPRLVRAAYVFINGFVTIGLLALLAVITGSPFVFHHSVRPHISSSFRP